MSAPWLVVSPHCDDAVLSCGALLAAHPGSLMATVFAGTPSSRSLTEWDAACGFRSGDDVMAARRAEDGAAAAVLGAAAVWLPFLDAQYGVPSALDAIAEALADLLAERRPQGCVFPLGFYHADHAAVHAAMLSVIATCPQLVALAYEDVPYRARPGLVTARCAELAGQGYRVDPLAVVATDDDRAAKRQALACYRSQLRVLAGPDGRVPDAERPEGYYRVTRAAA